MIETNKLTPVEWEIMEAIWNLGGTPSVREVLEHAFPNGIKAYSTVLTMMNILEKKGLLTRKKIGLVNFYKPTRSKDQMLKTEISHVVKNLFKGSTSMAATYLFNSENVSLQELEKIKEIISQKEKEMKDK